MSSIALRRESSLRSTNSIPHPFGKSPDCAISASEMGAVISVESEGPGCGASFTLIFQDHSSEAKAR
jgi:hypothetical protein